MSKFCSSCGEALKSADAVVCTNCGAGTGNLTQTKNKPWESGTITGLYILAFIMPLVGGIAGIVALFNDANRQHGVGLIVASFVFWIFWTFFLIGLFI
jgi:hypothetical protein